ncbi:MAG TPA: glycogen debranching protein GlgX [Alphaproteobacteria bacterium]|nr:glycogen debranching protein GlgX [Alphaproteobacteria bacterium]
MRPGNPLPLGVRDCCDGFNFAVFSRHAERMALLLFKDAGDADPWIEVDLDPAVHKTGDVWHVLIDGIGWGQGYAFRVHGPWAPTQGHRFNPRASLLDPYSLAVTGTQRWDFAYLAALSAPSPSDRRGDRKGFPSARSLLVDRRFDWQGVPRPKRSWSETVLYETHVRGLTIHPSSGASLPGTFFGVVEKIPYLLDLGVTAVELMPIQEFNSRDNPRLDPSTGKPLRNYWGYNTAAFFAPKESYGSGGAPGSQVHEFKTMVRELHRAGIEVILDVVFNHTAEGNEHGPTLSFRGLDNAVYYLLDEEGHYTDFTGCGNTLNCNHPVVRDYIIDCLRYWATEMQVDGFRFDLASILGRGPRGELLESPPLLERIAEDPILHDVKLIAEAWDAGGAFQVGRFPGQRWAEWNCHFRDHVRRYWRGDPGMGGAFAQRLCGSADLYQKGGKAPVSSVNFVTCHDGFTLNDLVSYAGMHNEANGEDNRDGPAEEFSANYGAEGELDDPAIERIHLRQIKNMLATLLVSRGVPMLLGGDEFRRTQRGNSNAYCQDNETSWYDWRLLERNDEIFRFVREMIRIRQCFSTLRSDSFYSDREVRWFDSDGRAPDWHRAGGALGMHILADEWATGTGDRGTGLCLLFNPQEVPVSFSLPQPPAGQAWKRVIDTARAAPDDICASGAEQALGEPERYEVEPGALAMLIATASALAG